MGLYERIRDLAKLKGYSVNRLEQELGFARKVNPQQMHRF